MAQYFLLSLVLLTVEGQRYPLSLSGGGASSLDLPRYGAMRYAEEFAFSLSAQAQGRVLKLAEYERVEPAHCPTCATSGGAGCERFFCGHTTLIVCARALPFA